MENKPALTIKETAKEYQFPEYAVRTLVKRGAFPVIQVGNRCYIMRSVFEEYLQKGGEAYVAAR
ncbi:MAG: helix-turn-helix domain-containing protein [Succiniclasticum sp.]|nr:helix-turn-helix domain-containing protein [Succiniclasticum sp.]